VVLGEVFMLIGKGMIANIFSSYKNDDNILIFASGVSNSNEKNKQEFLREKNLINTYLEQYPDMLFIYFSSCSLEDNELKNTHYHLHKKDMEVLIINHAKNYLIFRLPNIIGYSGNENNIINFFFNTIINYQEFTVWENATRNIVDIDDMYKVIKYTIENGIFNNKVINIAYNNNIKIIDLVNIIEEILDKKANYKKIDKGFDMKIDNSLIQPILKNLSIGQPKLSILINKYKGKL
jgi:nucleoside-diphosphate-sugar epimerase